MKRTFVKLISGLLVICLMFSAAPLMSFFDIDFSFITLIKNDNLAKAATAETHGSCGDNVFWSLDTDGLLTISGTGEIADYDMNSALFKLDNSIKTIKIEPGVTRVGDYAFFCCMTASSIEIPDTVCSIGEGAFAFCGTLITNSMTIFIPKCVCNIGVGAFAYIKSLKDLYYEGSVEDWKTIGGLNAFSISAEYDDIVHNYMPGFDFNAVIHFNSTGAAPTGVIPSRTKIFVNNNSATMALGDKRLLSVTINNPKKQKRIYSSSDPSVVSVSVVGVVTAKALGTATITVQTYDRQNTSTCEITVTEGNIAVTGLSLNRHTLNMRINSALNEAELWATIAPYDATNKNVSFTVEPVGIVQMTASNTRVKALKTGTATITATSADGKYRDQCFVTVTDTDQVAKISFGTEEKKYTVELNPDWFISDSKEYNHELGIFCSQMAMLGYKDANIIRNDVLAPLGFNASNAIVKMEEGKNSVNHIISSKTVYLNNQKKTLVIAGFIGSYGDQWISNFEPGTGTVHQGFEGAKNIVKQKLTAYLDKLNVKKEDTILLFFGHSRGAAVTNLMAADFITESKYASPDNIYAYAFATPSSSRDERERSKDSYKRIFNIVNPEDFVTWVLPDAWGYGKYGKTAILPCKTFDCNKWSEYYSKVNKQYNTFTGKDLNSYHGIGEVSFVVNHMTSFVPNINQFKSPVLVGNLPGALYYSLSTYFHDGLAPIVAQTSVVKMAAGAAVALDATKSNPLFFEPITTFFLKNGTPHVTDLFEDAHKAQTYAAFMMSISEEELWKDRSYKEVCAKCPVDIEVIDKTTGEVVAKIVNNEIDESIANKDNAMTVYVNGDCKTVIVPNESDYDILITGNDNGKMDYTVTTTDADGAVTDRVCYFDVPVEDGMVMSESTVYDDEGVAYTAMLNGCGEEVGEPYNITEEEICALSVEVKTEGIGYTTGSGSYTIGDYVTLSAETDENNTFLGWYAGDELLYEEEAFSFVLKNDVYVTARFTNVTVELTDITVSVPEIDLAGEGFCFAELSFTPENATNRTIVFQSSDETVAKVSNTGLVEGVSVGTAMISVTAADGKIVKTVPIEVKCSHTWNNGEITKPATATEEGEKTFTCTVCGNVKTEPIPKQTGEQTIDTDQAKEIGDTVYAAPGLTANELLAAAGNGAVLKDRESNTVPSDAVLSSGMVLTKADGAKKTIVVKGDNDGDGAVTAADARFALRVAVGLEAPNDWEQNACLVAGGAAVTAADARLILRAAVGLEELDLS